MWFGKRKAGRQRYKIVNQDTPEEWITVPFKYAEAARVSIYTIANQPGVPVYLQAWIAQWLASYNSQLISYMKLNYGPAIFPLLDKITRDVMPKGSGEDTASAPNDSWEKWERQFRED